LGAIGNLSKVSAKIRLWPLVVNSLAAFLIGEHMSKIEKAPAPQPEIISLSNVSRRIYTLRDRQVMLDEDLAEIYGFFGSSHLMVEVS
jgi:hypothetical protein